MTNQDLDARCHNCSTERADLIQMKRNPLNTREYTLTYLCEDCFDRLRDEEDGPQDDDHLETWNTSIAQQYINAHHQKEDLK